MPQLLLPEDAANRALIADVHPRDWRNPTPAGTYDLIAIGGGTAGLVSAAGAAALGARVALLERHLLGGDCLNVGCVPSKAGLRSARAIGEMKRAAALVWRVAAGEADLGPIMPRLRQLKSAIS